MKYLAYISTLFYSCLILGQSNTLFVEGDNFSEAGYFTEAINAYKFNEKKCTKKKSCDLLFLKMANSYFSLHDYQNALLYFDKNEDKKSWKLKDKINYFEVLKANKNYNKANSFLNEHKLFEYGYQENWIDTSLLETNTDFKLEDSSFVLGNSFTGITTYKGNYITSKETKDKEGKTTKQILSILKKDASTVFSLKTVLDITNQKETFYQGNPMSYKDSLLFFVQNNTDIFWYKEKNKSKMKLSEKGQNLLNIVLSRKGIDTLDYLNTLNGEYGNNVTPFFFDLNDKQILLFSSDREDENYNLFFSILDNEKHWSSPKKLKGINTQLDEVYPFVKDNKLFFTSRAYNTFGGLDIFEADFKFEENEITVANITNIGAPLNSPVDDFGLYWDSDTTGIFGSNRGKETRLDKIFLFNFSNTSKVKGIVVDNNGVPTASKLYISKIDEKGDWIIVDSLIIGKNGEYSYEVPKKGEFRFMFTSDGLEDKALYFFNSPEEARLKSIEQFKLIKLNAPLFTGNLRDAVSEEALAGAIIKIYKIEDGERILVGERIADKNGSWDFEFDRDKEYEIEIESRDYDRIILPLSREEPDRTFDFERISYTKVNSNKMIRINNIYFEFNSAEITTESYPILENLIVFLNTKSTVKIELSAHTDCIGPNDYNKKLSQKRAESCYNYLIEKGIAKNRILPVGYGEEQTLNPCRAQRKDDEIAKKNRRIEVKILD